MKANKILKINGTILDKYQLKQHLEKIASNHNLTNKSKKETYPIPNLIENFEKIKEVYFLLNEHLKLGISIHPAGEWLLDNFYVIEEVVKQIQKELPVKKYTNFVGIANGQYAGFARIYVLASEIVAFTDNKIEKDDLEEYLISYQTKKTLSMDEIWNIGIFLQIAIIGNIREICEKIYQSQIQKYKAENIVERLIENKPKSELKFKYPPTNRLEKEIARNFKYSFIEYMSYILKRYGKKGFSYLNALEEAVEMTGSTVSEVIKKEHFDIAVRKVSIGNSITSIKKVQRINFLEIFEKINGVEELLRKDPADVYEKMDSSTKEYYRTRIKEISKKTKISEIYIAKKILEIAQKEEKGSRKSHIGYYLIDDGVNTLYNVLQYKTSRQMKNKDKVKAYILGISSLTILISLAITLIFTSKIDNIPIYLISFFVFLLPASEVANQLIQYILSKIIKPKPIPKLDFLNGIDEENSTMVIIPTIIKSKEKVQELFKKLEVYYLANKSKNLYFTLLGDCSESSKKEEEFDKEVILEGLNQVEKLNKKYKSEQFPIFNFIYRKREWNPKEQSYLGWERKRGMINQFNEYLLGNIKDPFEANTLEKNKDKIPKIKYVITLDADTDLILNSAFELVGAMAHILNRPILDEQKNIVVDGYGIMQPRVGINLTIKQKTLFTKIFAGSGGIDSYTNAISDLYQDNFKEGIFTGKGIYDLEIFSKVLNNAIPENTVLSHDLLEGNYLRCGLVSDILLMDGYPTKYNSFITRLSRWIRGDWQITPWLRKNIYLQKDGIRKKIKNPLGLLAKYKIMDNLRRSLLEASILFSLIYVTIVGLINIVTFYPTIILLVVISIFPFLLEILNDFIYRKEGEKKQKTFSSQIAGIEGSFYRGFLHLATLPYKAYISLSSIIKTIYRMTITRKNLLEWTTSEEAEKQEKSSLISYYNKMSVNILAGVITIGIAILTNNPFAIILAFLWSVAPLFMWYISKESKETLPLEKLNEKERKYILDIGHKTWQFFEKYLTEENNFLIPDNYQEDRKNKIVYRTSSTNIGLSMLAVISAYDLNFIKLDKTIELLNNIILSVESLQKWNGHLYNWYEIKTKKPLIPRYVSTVDSGNLIGYMYVVKTFLENLINYPEDEKIDIKQIQKLKNIVENLINSTDFSVLYSKEHQIFSIGFNIEENKLTDSYYDLLASEARQASLVAISKRDVPVKHWNSLSKTLTKMDKYKGLISWSGTAFEYLMPNINIPKYEGSLLDESCKFMIMSQMEYSKKLGIPWGISESAFNEKDLHANYQYKAFGIPWLGLKRGLGDETVVSSYGSILAIVDKPKQVLENIKRLEQYGALGKFGLYESIDFTPERVEKGKTASVVKTYMAHHQGLILLSINNLYNNLILSKRFLQNPEIEAVSILLQETMPEKSIVTKENKEKVEKLKYKDYENYTQNTYKKIDERLIRGNVISNEDYVIAMNQKGEGVSKYKNIYINRFKPTSDYSQGIFFTIKNVRTKEMWSSNYSLNNDKQNYQISFMPDKIVQELVNGNIKTKIKTTIAANEPVEIRRVTIENNGNNEEMLELSSYFEPVLSSKEQDYSHPAFNNLFLVFDYDEKSNCLILKRKNRDKNMPVYYLGATLSTNSETIGDLEYEIDKEKFIGRGNLGIPIAIKNSLPFSKNIGLVTEPIVSLKRTIKIKPKQEISIDLIIGINNEKEALLKQMEKYMLSENVKEEFELAKARVEAESRYLRIKGKEIENYQKMLSYMIFDNPAKVEQRRKAAKRDYSQNELWKYGISGDLPIILVKITDVNDSYVIKEVLKAYEFFKTKNVECEIVILDEEKHSYENYVREEIENAILNTHMAYMKNIRGGIFVLNKGEIEKQDITLLEFVSSITIDSKKGGIENCLKELEDDYLENYKDVGEDATSQIIVEEKNDDIDILENHDELKYYNEYGAFSEDGKEYKIKVNTENRLPTAWSHIMANEKFGTIVTESMGGYSWYKNSRLSRVSSWENSPVYDTPSEIIYLKDMKNKKTWSLGLNSMPDDRNYNAIFGFGYCKYIHKSDDILQELEVFVPKEDSCKVGILTLSNNTQVKKKLKIYYYIKPVIGEDEIKTNTNIDINFDKNNNIICAKNLYYFDDSPCQMYVSSSEKINSYTGNKKFFQGKGGLKSPDGIKKVALNNENSLGRNTCIAYEIEVEIEGFEQKEIAIVLGAEDTIVDCKNIAYKYSKIQNCKQELENVKRYWNELLGRLQVYTPIESNNILLNGWMAYQIIESRLLGRSGYYQSGGAFGFRDQLQDTLGLKYIDPDIMKKQIIKHSKHQFIEGDVEHWWHEEGSRGIRTRFTDDLLWLVYLTLEYIEFTGDKSILDIETSYLEGKVLEEGVDEKYDKYLTSEVSESIYKHCIKAIDKSLNFGKNGLPKIGSGDWNDGFSTVGNKGKGESIWLGFFLYNILDRWIPICKERENLELANKYEKIKQELKSKLNTNGWDGRWYRRAYMDDGNVLGSIENDECRIDSIAQSWSVISNAGDNEKKYISMESLENHLIDKENGIIKLLDPPFEKSNLEPGYIKAYLPGVRENGGQYTHECCC